MHMADDKAKAVPTVAVKTTVAPPGGATGGSGSRPERPVPTMQTYTRTMANDADPFTGKAKPALPLPSKEKKKP